MNKRFFTGLLFFLLCTVVSAEENNSLSITPKVGVMNGKIGEYVFIDFCKNTDNKLSYLEWDIKNLHTVSLEVNYTFSNKIQLLSNFTFGIPKKSGYLQDFDWMNSLATSDIEIPNVWQYDDPTELTNYSKHTNTITNYFDYSFSVGYNFKPSINNFLTPFFQYENSHIRFDATDGYLEYKIDKYTRHNLKGKQISYEADLGSLFLGLSYYTESIPYVGIKIDLLINPGFSYININDYHWQRSCRFVDSITGATEYKGNVELTFRFNKHNKLGFWGNIDYIPLSYGSDVQYNQMNYKTEAEWYNKHMPAEGTAGFDKFTYSYGIIYTYSF